MCVSRYPGDVIDLLERGLTPEAAARTANALGFLARELITGRLEGDSADSSLQSPQPGATQS